MTNTVHPSVTDTFHNIVIVHAWCALTSSLRRGASLTRIIGSYTYLVTYYFQPLELLRGIWCAALPMTSVVMFDLPRF